MGIMRTKSIEQSIRDTEEPEFQLRKALGPLELTLFGIGVIIGTGLFVLTGEAAANYAGPAVALSYVVGGIVCALAYRVGPHPGVHSGRGHGSEGMVGVLRQRLGHHRDHTAARTLRRGG